MASGLLALGISTSASASDGLKVVASIKPLHALVAAVMDGVGTPSLLLRNPASAHHFSLRPSEARLLQNADLVFWIGPSLETPLQKILDAVAPQAQSEVMMQTKGLTLLAMGIAKHAKHAKHDDHAAHDEHAMNPHIWLDPVNAQIMLRHIAAVLAEADPVNAAIYKSNAGATALQLAALSDRLADQLAPYKNEGHGGKGFLVLHDAHVYFETRFGLRTHAAITSEPDIAPGASQIRRLRTMLDKENIRCIFDEPDHGASAINLIVRDRDVAIVTLDPLGNSLQDSPSFYLDLLENYGTAMQKCLSH